MNYIMIKSSLLLAPSFFFNTYITSCCGFTHIYAITGLIGHKAGTPFEPQLHTPSHHHPTLRDISHHIYYIEESLDF